MDSAYPHPQAMSQSPFFYYNPDPKPDNRQHGHFSQHPTMQIPMYHQHIQPMPSTPIYSRPGSSCSQPPMPVQVFNAAYQGAMTPMASPRPIYQKPTVMMQEHAPRLILDSDANESDLYYYPSTPPLSTPGSTISSPSSCDVLQTPMNTTYFGFHSFEGVKEGCRSEVLSENLAGGDWARWGSPPMTPVYIRPSLISGTNELLSATACPSLSPSPARSPYPQSNLAEHTFDFCDPRNLIVGANQSSPTASAEFPTLPTLCAGDDQEHHFMLGGEPFVKAAVEPNFDFTSAPHHGVPAFDDFSDLDSEDDFVNGLVNFPATDNVQLLSNKRQRTSSLLSITENFVIEDDFEDFEECEQFAVACLPSPPASGSDSECSPEKRAKKAKICVADEDSTDFDSMVRSRKFTVPMNNAVDAPMQETSEAQQQSSTAPSQSGSSEANTVTNMLSSGAEGATPQQAPVNRRGRKQSLTEDPSKTFVCDLCNRRFRRQEHLKRHYRSLHTHDKPFECHECGKKFSRSDNLSQHARTHGSGAIVMGVLEEGEMPHDHLDSASDGEIRSLGKVLFEVAAAASGSDISDGSTSESDSQSRKKRKRSE